MRYCKLCVTPQTRPRIEFDNEGVCNACRYAETKKNIDWKKKAQELKDIVKKYKRSEGYDCIVPVSGGKDSHFQTHYVKEVLGLTPLCVTFNPAMPSEIGVKNRENLINSLAVDHILITPDPKMHAKLAKIMLKEHGNVFLPWIQGVFAGPTRVAVEKKIPLIFYGDNGEAEYGGATNTKEATSIESSAAVNLRVQSDRPNWKNPENWDYYGIPKKSLTLYIEPTDKEKEEAGVKRLFLGDYIPWNNNQNLNVALNIIGGFTLRETRIAGTYTHGTSMDDDLDELYLWFLWPKFGFHRASKSASPDIREGKLTREKAIELVRKYDGEFPWDVFDRTLDYLDMSEEEFWDVVKRFIGDEENIKREIELANGSPVPNKIPAWEKISSNKWKHIGTIHGEDRFLELPLSRPSTTFSGE